MVFAAIALACSCTQNDQEFPRRFYEQQQKTPNKIGEHSLFEGPHRLRRTSRVFDPLPETPDQIETLSEENIDNPIRKYKMALARERFKHLPPDKVIDALQLRDGMTIVDIGAAAGFFSVPFAKALHGTGKVYATDIDPQMIDLLRLRRDAEGLQNLEPVLVCAADVDPFYRDKSFDVMFLCSIYEYLMDPVPYFRELGKSLTPKTGRLVLIHPRLTWRYQPEDFYNYQAIFDNLLKQGEEHPLFRRMAPELREYILKRQYQVAETIPAKYPQMFAEALNVAAEDPRLVNELLADAESRRSTGEYAVASRLQHFRTTARWIYFAHWELFQPPYPVRTDEDREAVAMINKCLLIPLFIGHPYFEGHKIRREAIASDKEVIRKMAEAGFGLHRRHDFASYFHIMEFVRTE
jgi:ubiquinone/menaquinone biosynthesis C-methylase UbiE